MFCFPLYPLHITNLFLMIFFLFTIITFLIKPFNPGKTILLNLIFVLPFLPYLIEFIISGSNPIVSFEFEKKLFFFSAPLIIPVFFKITGFRNYKLALAVFSASMILLTVYSLFVLIFNGVPFNQDSYDNGAYILRYNFETISGLHPTTYSAFAMSAAVFLFFNGSTNSKTGRAICFSFAFFLLIFVLFVATRIALITGLALILIWIFKSKISLMKKIVMVYTSILIVMLLSVAIPSLNSRVDEVLALKNGSVKPDNTLSQRIIIMDCTWGLISENFLFGKGVKNSQSSLNNCYLSKGWLAGSEKSYDPHNQYLVFGLNYGIFDFLAFIILMIVILRKTLEFKESLYYFVIILIFFLSESLLESQMGVYFFGLFSLLFYNCLKIQNNGSVKLN